MRRDVPNPVSLSDDSGLRRLGEYVREVFRRGGFLSRLLPGNLEAQQQATGPIYQLAWGEMNRLPPGNVVARLPQMQAENIGVPLVVCKGSTGIIALQPAGIGTDGQPVTVNGVATGAQLSAPGAFDLMADGRQWFARRDAAPGAAGTATGASLGEIQLHDTTHNPVALFQFQENITDTSGRGTVMTEDAGQARFAILAQRTKGLQFSGLRLKSNPGSTWLRLQSDMTFEMLGAFETVTSGIFANYTGGNSDAAESLNYQWQVQCLSPRDPSWFSEHGVGVNDRYTPTMMAFPPPGEPFHFAVTRISDRIQNYINGAPFGTLSPTLITPTGGESAHFFIGGEGGTGAFSTLSNFVMASLKVIPTGLSAAAVKAEYARTLGPYLGTSF